MFRCRNVRGWCSVLMLMSRRYSFSAVTIIRIYCPYLGHAFANVALRSLCLWILSYPLVLFVSTCIFDSAVLIVMLMSMDSELRSRDCCIFCNTLHWRAVVSYLPFSCKPSHYCLSIGQFWACFLWYFWQFYYLLVGPGFLFSLFFVVIWLIGLNLKPLLSRDNPVWQWSYFDFYFLVN